MAFDVSEFSAQINALGGLQNPTKFRVTAFPPNDSGRSFEFLCHTSQEPGLTIATTQVRTLGYGAPTEAPLAAAYGEVTLSCYLDNDGYIQGLLTRWQQSVINFNYQPGGSQAGEANAIGPFQVGYLSDYGGIIELHKFNQDGDVIRVITLYSAWPKIISPVHHSWIDKDRITSIDVALAYRSWTSDDMTENGDTPDE